MICFIFVVLCGLSGSALAKGKANKTSSLFSLPGKANKTSSLFSLPGKANKTYLFSLPGKANKTSPLFSLPGKANKTSSLFSLPGKANKTSLFSLPGKANKTSSLFSLPGKANKTSLFSLPGKANNTSSLFSLPGKVVREPKGKFSVPVLDVKSRQLVLEANQTLTIHCRGRWELSWVFPGGVARDKEIVQLEDSRCGRQSQHYCSQLIISSAQAQHTGSFRCRYSHRTRKQSAVYIYVTDRQRPFVEEQNKSPDLVYIKESQPLVFPCRVTNPDATVSLVKFPDRELTPDQRNIVWNSRQGFLIRSPTYFYIGLFSCKTSVNGTTHSLSYLTHRQVNKILEVYLNSTSPVQTLQGDSLAINCTVTAEWNSRVSISWDYPGQVNRAAIISRRIMASKTHMVFYSILSIPKLHRSDRGLYICRVTSGPVSRETNVSVTVYDRPYIRLTPRQGAIVEAHAGQKSYRLSPKLRAFPAPEIIWLKDGKVAAEQCSRYHVDGNSLVIRDVAEEDAGKYTILVGIQEHRLYQNLTLSLVVNVSPGIGEKAVSLQDPGSVPQGSRQALHCSSHGVPPPHIAWLWHPCPPKDTVQCNSDLKSRVVKPHFNRGLFCVLSHFNRGLFCVLSHFNRGLFCVLSHFIRGLFCALSHFNRGLFCALSHFNRGLFCVLSHLNRGLFCVLSQDWLFSKSNAMI
uniref:Platelet-derived growth factor receptor-like protein n=1 Tax=Salmo trutta TaxID=8032 RepID=A0A673Y5Q6_SALTR